MREPYIGNPYTRLTPQPTRLNIDSAPMREHIETLRACGMTNLMIARAAGTSESPLGRVLRGQKRVNSDVAAAVLAVTPRPHPQQALVVTFSTRRRIEALYVLGWSTKAIAEEMGVPTNIVWRARVKPRISWGTYRTVCATYERLSVRDGGCAVTKAKAASRGYVHPFDWDDIDAYDELPSTPERLNVHQYRAEELSFLREQGLSESAIAEKLGLSLYGLQQWERRHGEVAA